MTRLSTLSLACALAATPMFAGTLLDQGYAQMYNRQFEDAHRSFAEWSTLHPQDPMGPASDAAAYVFSELDRMHILQSEFFTGDGKPPRSSIAPDPVLKQKLDTALDRSRQLADAALATAPGDENAMLASVVRYGLRSNYLALIERRYMPALDEMKSGRMLAEKLLAQNPTCYDAHLALGVENYLLSLKSAPVRWFLRVGHAKTDKAEGIANLRITAENGHYLRPFAKLLLAVAALRDNDRPKARQLLQALADEYPGNPLYTQELARLATPGVYRTGQAFR